MLFLEILLSIHCLLLISSWIVGGHWLQNQPSLKLGLARILLISCVMSPLVIHCISYSGKLERLHYVSLDALQGYVNQPVLNTNALSAPESISAVTITSMSYCQLFYLLFGVFILFRVYQVMKDFQKLSGILREAIPYRCAGKLVIKVSDRCHIPFSVCFFNKAYILLPVSLFSSAKNVRIAIAHEGQHHRSGDCLWAWFIEALRVIFFANPGVTRWRKILSELQELSCDEVLVGQPNMSAYDYGRCLFDVVQTVSQCSLSSSREFACTVGMAVDRENEDRTFIIRRISMLSTYPGNASKSLISGIAFASFFILTPICAAYSVAGTLSGFSTNAVNLSHLDPGMQQIAQKEITRAVKQYHAQSGVIAIADPANGHVIAFAEAGDSKWASRVFSPGSTIKPFIAAAAIDSGHSFETKTYDCHSPYLVEGKTFTDNPDVGSTSLTDAIAKSSNVCLIKVSRETGAPVIRKKLSEFGFDVNTWWQTNQNENVQLAMASFGENIPVTIESLTKSYAILANNGRGFDKKNKQVISEKTTDSVKHILENAVTNGTGKQAVISGVSVAGKTGTVVENSNLSKGKNLALFAGYVPANAPRYVILVVLEDGHNGKSLTSGGELAAPVFRHVAISGLRRAALN